MRTPVARPDGGADASLTANRRHVAAPGKKLELEGVCAASSARRPSRAACTYSGRRDSSDDGRVPKEATAEVSAAAGWTLARPS